jgi:hypothetical protein
LIILNAFMKFKLCDGIMSIYALPFKYSKPYKEASMVL